MFLALMFSLLNLNTAQAAVLDQAIHSRVLLIDGWSGNYLRTDYNMVLNNLRIDYCVGNTLKSCEQIADPIDIQTLELYESELVMNLKKLRREYAKEIDANIFKFILGDSKSNSDVKVIDQVIHSVQKGGIEELVLVTDENLRELAPELNSTDLTDRIAKTFADTFAVQQKEFPNENAIKYPR